MPREKTTAAECQCPRPLKDPDIASKRWRFPSPAQTTKSRPWSLCAAYTGRTRRATPYRGPRRPPFPSPLRAPGAPLTAPDVTFLPGFGRLWLDRRRTALTLAGGSPRDGVIQVGDARGNDHQSNSWPPPVPSGCSGLGSGPVMYPSTENVSAANTVPHHDPPASGPGGHTPPCTLGRRVSKSSKPTQSGRTAMRACRVPG